MSLAGSGVARIVSASGASWVRIGITVFAQVALVPLYLSSWSPEVFGAWLLLQAVWGTVTLLDLGHQDFVGYECLRLGPAKRQEIIQALASALPVALIVALFDLGLVWGVTQTGFSMKWVGLADGLYQKWRAALLLQAGVWLLMGSWVAMVVKGLAPFGHFPRVAWWNTVYALITAAAPGVAVLRGADLLGAMITFSVASVLCNLGCILDLYRVIRPRGLLQIKPSLELGGKQMLKSLWLTANGLIGMVRQQGVRLLLTPLSGVTQMAAFSTMRTGANFALQGLGTVTAPLMPELMRFLAFRDQPRTESAFAVVWLMLCAVLSPAVLIVQYFAPLFFPLWTRGKIEFDPALFSMLSSGVLIFALAQPASAVVTGNNLLRSQLAISVTAGVTTILGMLLLVPIAGMRGAAFVLVLAELVNLLICVYVASMWLRRNGMRWPERAFGAAAVTVVVACGGLAAMTLFPGQKQWLLGIFLLLEIAATVVYWRSLPSIAGDRAISLLARFIPRRWRGRWLGLLSQTP